MKTTFATHKGDLNVAEAACANLDDDSASNASTFYQQRGSRRAEEDQFFWLSRIELGVWEHIERLDKESEVMKTEEHPTCGFNSLMTILRKI